VFDFGIHVPPDPWLSGVDVFFQSIVLPPAGGLYLTHPAQFTIF
jgi:hypothetical protein